MAQLAGLGVRGFNSRWIFESLLGAIWGRLWDSSPERSHEAAATTFGLITSRLCDSAEEQSCA